MWCEPRQRSTSRDEDVIALFTPTGANGLEPGDTIIVPVNEEYQPTLARYKEVSTVVSKVLPLSPVIQAIG